MSKNYFIILYFNIMVYFTLSFILHRTIFTSEVDGFYYQIMAVSSGNDLGSLSIMHNLRLIIIYPFYLISKFNLPISLQHLCLLIYILPLVFIKIPLHMKYFSLMLLYFSLFFSYRTILVMESLFILIMIVKYRINNKKYLFFSVFLSFLSSGTLLVWILIIYNYRKIFILNKKFLKYMNIVIIFLVILMIGPISHKILFFINPVTYGSATSVTSEAILNISIEELKILFTNIIERSMIVEAFEKNNYIRISIIVSMFFMIMFLSLVKKDLLTYIILLLYLLGILFEGLIVYSLFFFIFSLFYDYLYRNLKGLLVVEKNIN